MALIDSVGGLYSAVNNKVGALTSVAKGALCLPAILSGLPGILGNVAKGVLGSLRNQALGLMGGVAGGLAGLITVIIQDAVDQVTGIIKNTINQILQLQATILATIGLIEDTLLNIQNQVKDALDFAKSQENCRFAAAEMFKCLAGSIINDLSKKSLINAKFGTGDLVSNAISKLAKPGNVIEGYTNKISNSVDKATSQINNSKLI
jgi:hypothetical protein